MSDAQLSSIDRVLCTFGRFQHDRSMTTLTQRIGQLDQIRQILVATRSHFDQMPSARALPAEIEPIEHEGVVWKLQYETPLGALRASTINYRFRGRTYQVEAVVRTEPLRVEVQCVWGETGRTTYARPIRVTVEGDLYRLMTMWLHQNHGQLETARERSLRVMMLEHHDRLQRELHSCIIDAKRLGEAVEEFTLDPHRRSLFRQLQAANPDADPGDIARIATDLTTDVN